MHSIIMKINVSKLYFCPGFNVLCFPNCELYVRGLYVRGLFDLDSSNLNHSYDFRLVAGFSENYMINSIIRPAKKYHIYYLWLA